MSKSRSGSPRRVAAGLLAGALTVFGIALAPQAGATTSATGDRIAGTNRYGTAKAIAAQPDFAGAKTAILATGQNFPDALAASGIAGAKQPAPIVLTESTKYTPEAKDALKALSSVTDVIIVGGTAAVSDAVKSAVAADGFNVSRLAGTNRYATAAAIGNAIGASNVGSVGGKKTAIIASGENFPDALAGGPLGYANKMPILLVHPGSVPAETSQALKDLAIKHVIVLGGTAAVSDATKTAIDGITAGDSERIAGVNRSATAVAIAKVLTTTFASLGFDGTAVLLANGQNFPDALAGGPLGGDPEPIILGTPTALPPETTTYCDDASPKLGKITALGGTAAIGDAVLGACVTAAKNTANDNGAVNGTATTRPELVSATLTVVDNTIATNTRPAGSYVKECFDEGVTGAGPVAAQFHLYKSDGTRFSGTPAGGATTAPPGATSPGPVPTAGDAKCVDVHFADPALDTAAEAAALTVATVDDGAVTGASLDTNPEGDVGITTGAASTVASSGVTSGPDLTSADNFRVAATSTNTAVDLHFDSVAWINNTAGFHLVRTTGAIVDCTGPAEDTTNAGGGVTTIAGGEGTNLFTVICPGNWTSATIVRAFMDANAVDATDTFTAPGNPLESVDVSASGISDGPDLTGVIFSPDAVPSFDTVAYLFDEAVNAGPYPAGAMRIYDTSGAETFTGGCSRSTDASAGNKVVICLVADNTFSGATFVGGNVTSGAVTDLQAIAGAGDEEGAAPTAGTTQTSGLTSGPDLQGVAIKSTTSPFGTVSHSATYTFDEDTTDTVSPDAAQSGEEVVLNLLHLYTSDGIRLDCTSLSDVQSGTATLTARDEATDNTVTCIHYVVAGGAVATDAQIASAVLGTVDFGAVDDESVAADAFNDQSPEGGALTTGGTGTPAS